jgi:hypothetical protein
MASYGTRIIEESSRSERSNTLLSEVTLSRALALRWALVSMLGFFVSLGVFAWLYGMLTSGSLAAVEQSITFDGSEGILDLLTLVVLMAVIILPHEFVHGLAIRWFGGTPRYGVGLAHFVLPHAYATTDHRFTRNQFIVIALAPLVALTLVGVALMTVFEWAWLIVPLAANAGGAVGDCWMVLTLLSYPAHVRVEDSTTGFRIFGREDDHPSEHLLAAGVWDVVTGIAVGFGVVTVGGLSVPWMLPALGIGSLTIGQPGTVTLLFEFTSSVNGYSYATGPGSLLVGAGLGLVYAVVRSRSRMDHETVQQ